MSLLFEHPLLDWCLICIPIITFLYHCLFSVYDYWEDKGVIYIKPVILFGNIKDIVLKRRSISEVFRDLYNTYPDEPYIGIYEIFKPALIIRDPELCKQMMVKDFGYFQDRGFKLSKELDPLSNHLIFADGILWKFLRSKLTPTFTSGKMKMMFHLMNNCAEILKTHLDKPATNGENVEIKDIMSKFTTDIIGSCAFGIDIDSLKNPDSQFRLMAYRAFPSEFWYSVKRTIKFSCPQIANFLRIEGMPEEVNNFFINLFKEVTENREKNNIIRNDFIHLLIQLKNQGYINTEGDENDEDKEAGQDLTEATVNKYEGHEMKDENIVLTDKLLAAQLFSFFIGGFETSATTLTFALYELALDKKVQSKLKAEIDAVLLESEGKITYECIQKMTYLNQVFNEVLRLYPPIQCAVRTASKPYVIPGTNLQLDVGQKIIVPLCAIHYDTKYFENPYHFNPENFSKEAIASRPNYTHMPFGVGPRNCIGMRFGTLETKLGLITLLSNFEFDICEKTVVPLKLDPNQFFGSPLGEVWLKITKRQ